MRLISRCGLDKLLRQHVTMTTSSNSFPRQLNNKMEDGPLYSAEQITIPPSLPTILKDFTKAAIRTQPDDVLAWSSAYFEALSKGQKPPVKSRYELIAASSSSDTAGGLSKGRLATLHTQMNGQDNVTLDDLKKKWIEVGCHENKLSEILSLGDLYSEEGSGDIPWRKVLALACTSLEQNISNALKVLCQIMSTDLEGGDARIDFSLFSELYTFLAKCDGDIGETQIQRALSWLKNESERFEGRIGPREFEHPNCPKLKTKSSL